MPLVVEDGTGDDPTANSYSSAADIVAYAAARGVTLVANAALDILAIKAMDYIESFHAQFQGRRTSTTQPLQWPRFPVYLYGSPIDGDVMPVELARMQAQLCIEQNNGVELLPTVTDPFIKREKVDVIEIEYSDTVRTSGRAVIDTIKGYLAALTNPSGGSLRSIRV